MDKEKTLRKLREEIEEVRKKFGVDFAEVVRCRECTYYGDRYFCPLHSWEGSTAPEKFCSFGKRSVNE